MQTLRFDCSNKLVGEYHISIMSFLLFNGLWILCCKQSCLMFSSGEVMATWYTVYTAQQLFEYKLAKYILYRYNRNITEFQNQTVLSFIRGHLTFSMFTFGSCFLTFETPLIKNKESNNVNINKLYNYNIHTSTRFWCSHWTVWYCNGCCNKLMHCELS